MITLNCQCQIILLSLELATDPWGVHVDRVEIKDVRLPQQMQVRLKLSEKHVIFEQDGDSPMDAL